MNFETSNIMPQYQQKAIYSEIEINAGLDEAWAAWTTEEGVKSFFAPECNIELEVEGLYEIFFMPDEEPGRRGADGMRIMALEPKKMFSFTWNAPLEMPEIRKQRTHVILKFKPLAENKTQLTFIHDGWGDGEEWDKAFDYFTRAWLGIVLPRLIYRFEHGPVDWNNPPQLK